MVGSADTSGSRSPTTSRCSPSAKATWARSMRAARRSSFSLAASAVAHCSVTKSLSGSPRHRPNASS